MSVTDESKDFHEFATGAVRSKDADDCRYDLISPIAVAAVAKLYAEGIGEHLFVDDQRLTPAQMLGKVKELNYLFLAGQHEGTLELAAALLLSAIQDIENPELPDSFSGEIEPTDNGYDLIPPAGLRAVARAHAEGSAKGYSDYNWEKGMDIAGLLNHELKHIDKHLEGVKSDEPDLGHAAWNAFGAIHSLRLWPHLNEKLRGPGCVPPREPAKPTASFCQECTDKPLCDQFGCLGDAATRDAEILACYQSAPAPPVKPSSNLHVGSRPVLYLSGPMSGYPNLNFPSFNFFAEKLRRKGFPVLNPAELATLGHADVLVQLPGWENSEGATLEFSKATGLGKKVVSLSEALELDRLM